MEGATHALSGVLDLGLVAAALASKLNCSVIAGLRGVASSDPGRERCWLMVGADDAVPSVHLVDDAQWRLLADPEPAFYPVDDAAVLTPTCSSTLACQSTWGPTRRTAGARQATSA